jgi:hypothetical protein
MKRLLTYLVALVAFAVLAAAILGGGTEADRDDPPPGTAAAGAVPLPADFPDWRFESLRPVPFGLFVVAFSAPENDRPWVIVADSEGVPRWWYNPQTRALWGQVLGNGDVTWARSFGDGYGLDPRMAHEVRSESGKLLRLVDTGGSIVDGHEYRELPNGNVLLDTYVPETADLRRFGGPKRAAIVSAEVQEVDPAG